MRVLTEREHTLMNSKGEENRSVRLTRKRLSDALITLLMQKPVREITVRELTELANVSRGTFYFHYTDIYDLMDHVEREQIHTLELLMDDILPRLEEDSTPEALRALFSYLDENDGICSVLLGTNGDTAFVHRLKGVIEEVVLATCARGRKKPSCSAIWWHLPFRGALAILTCGCKTVSLKR